VLDLVGRAGLPWSVDPSSSAFAAGTPFLEWTAGAGVCFPNEDEADVLGDPLRDAYEVLVLKRGADGVRVVRRGAGSVDVAAAPATVVDLTGAGDACAAGFLAARLRGEDDEACARAAVAAAAEAIGKPGARPG
jgi:sugar/nucleoside kinase (ribokinase family)